MVLQARIKPYTFLLLAILSMLSDVVASIFFEEKMKNYLFVRFG